MKNFHTKRIFLLSYFLIFLFSPHLVFAGPEEEKNLLKVYYSEPIGAGEKVYHLTACEKTRAYAPLRCSKALINSNTLYTKQCQDSKGKVMEGTLIKGCIKENPEYYGDDESLGYLKVDVASFDVGKCKDTPSQQGFVYAPEWLIVGSSTDLSKSFSASDVLGTVLSEGDPGSTIIDKISKGGAAGPLFRATRCVSWDVIAEGENKNKREPQGKLQGLVEKFYNKVSQKGQALIDAGCNNDNSSQDIPGLDRSLPYNSIESLSCSIKERISGKTGSDILGTYVSAIYRWAAGIVGIVSVLIMVFSGIQISMAGGDSAKIDTAKNRIMQSLIGLAILFLSGLILYTINPSFFTG